MLALLAFISLAVSANPGTDGQPVTLIATVSPADAVDKVTFYDGVTILGIRSIVAGQATLTTTQLPTGVRTLRARASGVTSAPLRLTVNSIEAHGFAPPIPLPASTVLVADFNGDGIPDLISPTNIYLGKGDGTFQPPIPYTNPLPNLPVAADFNGDGILDLAGVTADDHIAVLLGVGDGTFLAPIITPGASSGATAIAVADFNNDGIADLAIAGNTLSIYLGNGDATFRSPSPSMQSGNSLALGDFDNDGVPDLIVGEGSSLVVLLGRGDGSFTALPAIRSAGSVAVGDVNGDGLGDTYATAVPNLTLAADFNGDGVLDLAGLTADGRIAIVLGTPAAPSFPQLGKYQ